MMILVGMKVVHVTVLSFTLELSANGCLDSLNANVFCRRLRLLSDLTKCNELSPLILLQAVKDMGNIYPSKVMLVPIEEMTDGLHLRAKLLMSPEILELE